MRKFSAKSIVLITSIRGDYDLETEVFIINPYRKSPKLAVEVLRFLLSKYRYEGINQDDLEQIWLLSETLFESLKGSQTARKINNQKISFLMPCLKMLDCNCVKKGSPRMIPFEFLGCSDFFLTAHTYYGMKFSNFQVKVKKTISYKVDKKTEFPDQKFIGVGYKDKGTQSNLSYDGSPHWKEISTCVTTQTRLLRSRIYHHFKPENSHSFESYFEKTLIVERKVSYRVPPRL